MDHLASIWQEIVSRPEGPMAFRFYLQPLMSTISAIVHGLGDARQYKPPYFWAVLTDASHRAELVRDGWKSIRNVFFLAIVLDLVYQFTVLGGFRPLQGTIVAVILAILPYLLVRGPVNRLARRFGRDTPAGRA
jgi:hypothetical protein